MSSDTSNPEKPAPENGDAAGKERDWWWLDDLVSLLTLLLVILAPPAVAAGIATGVIETNLVVDLALTGSIDVGLLFTALFVLALIDVYSRRRIGAALGVLGRVASNYNPPGEREREGGEE
jgi:hypothetical protein